MWTKEIFGTEVIVLIQCFILYSIMGWFVESVYISICEHRITNRGFATSPLCPIYGFGGVLGYLILQPLSRHPLLLYIAGAIVATVFEFLVAKLMQHIFDEVWWDYSEKPLNYKGVICVESTLAWGIYAVVIVSFLHGKILSTVGEIPTEKAIITIRLILSVYIIDFIYHLLYALSIKFRESMEEAKERYRVFRTKW